MAKNCVLDATCEIAWAKIIEEDSKVNGGFTAIHQINDYKSLGVATKDFILVRGALLQLSFVVDNTAIAMLAKKGYKIDTSSASSYSKSLTECIKRSESYNSRIAMKRNEMVTKYGNNGKQPKLLSYEDIIADLNTALGWPVEKDITLASFNSYKKTLKSKVRGNK